MKLTITAKNFELTEGIDTKIKEKTKKIEKYISEDADVRVTLSTEKLGGIKVHKTEIAIHDKAKTVRSSVGTDDMYKSIGGAVDTAIEQLKKTKDKSIEKMGRESLKSVRQMMQQLEDANPFSSGGLFSIREDDVDYLPDFESEEFKAPVMSKEDAINDMRETGADFYIFRDADTDGEPICVTYETGEDIVKIITIK